MPMFSDSIAVVEINGELGVGRPASADKIIPVLRTAFENEKVKVVILEINSGGGSPTESERINYEIDRLKQKYHKPIWAVIDTLGASAAYMIAIHTDKIVAGRYSLVGSIGVIMQGIDAHKLAERFDIKQNVYVSGPFKDLMNPLRAPSEEEKKVLQAIVDNAATTFIEEVKTQRGARLTRNDIFTGQVWNGSDAVKFGLIDEVGTIESVTAGSKLKIQRMSPLNSSMFGASFAHELGAGIAEGLATAMQSNIKYGK